MRPFLVPLALAGLALLSACSCKGVPDPWLLPKDAQWMALVPPAEEDPAFGRYEVQFATAEAPGTIVIDTKTRLLHLVLPGGKAIRYGVTVGDEAFG